MTFGYHGCLYAKVMCPVNNRMHYTYMFLWFFQVVRIE